MTGTTLNRILLALVVACASAGAARAQGASAGVGEQAEAARLHAEVIRLYREGKYDEALPLAKRVLELREKAAAGGEDLEVARAVNNLAALYLRKGKNEEAEQLLRRSLGIAERRLGAESEFVSDVVSQIGLLKLNQKEYGEAGPLLLRALKVKEKLHGADGADVVPVLLNLTDLYFLRREPEQARGFLGRAASIIRRQPPRKDAATASRLKNYYCALMALRAGTDRELTNALDRAIWRLEEPEKAAQQDKERKEREARGEEDKKIVEGEVLNGRVVSKPQPEYPRTAKDQRVSGVVVVEILVDESGKVIEAEALCGHPLLARASVEAARQARFTPTLLAGKPVKVSGIITYNFVLQ
jgi:TonB family protein